jgi:hypothetical protein
MITHDATLAFTQFALSVASTPRDLEISDAARYQYTVQEALRQLALLQEMLSSGRLPDVTAVAKFIMELEAANM